jgi:hypothetical protein
MLLLILISQQLNKSYLNTNSFQHYLDEVYNLPTRKTAIVENMIRLQYLINNEETQ